MLGLKVCATMPALISYVCGVYVYVSVCCMHVCVVCMVYVCVHM